jgi:hypothetical protein
MALNATQLQFDEAVNCTTPQTSSETRELVLTAFYGFVKNTTFPYGADNNVTVLANSFKFNVESSNW